MDIAMFIKLNKTITLSSEITHETLWKGEIFPPSVVVSVFFALLLINVKQLHYVLEGETLVARWAAWLVFELFCN